MHENLVRHASAGRGYEGQIDPYHVPLVRADGRASELAAFDPAPLL